MPTYIVCRDMYACIRTEYVHTYRVCAYIHTSRHVYMHMLHMYMHIPKLIHKYILTDTKTDTLTHILICTRICM